MGNARIAFTIGGCAHIALRWREDQCSHTALRWREDQCSHTALRWRGHQCAHTALRWREHHSQWADGRTLRFAGVSTRALTCSRRSRRIGHTAIADTHSSSLPGAPLSVRGCEWVIVYPSSSCLWSDRLSLCPARNRT